MVGCVVPIIGPIIVDKLYDDNPEWEKVHLRGSAAKKHHRKRYARSATYGRDGPAIARVFLLALP